MNDFTLDTSGYVLIGPDVPPRLSGRTATLRVDWPDLDAFTQGYVEAAMLAIQWPDPTEGHGPSSSVIRFDWLAPEALAMILADCAEAQRVWGADASAASDGAYFWRIRQDGTWFAFPPLTVSIGDGKIILAVQS